MDMAIGSLKSIPPYGHREVLLLLTKLCAAVTCACLTLVDVLLESVAFGLPSIADLLYAITRLSKVSKQEPQCVGVIEGFSIFKEPMKASQ